MRTAARSGTRAAVLVAGGLVLGAIAPGLASAAVVAESSIGFPAASPNVPTVGQELPATITLSRGNTGAEEHLPNTVCNPDADPLPAPCTDDLGILIAPSCTEVTGNSCTTVDPNAISFVGNEQTAEPGSACTGRTFRLNQTGISTGIYELEQKTGAAIVLDDAHPSCTINLTIEINREPVDSSPAAGVQTTQVLTHRQFNGTTSDDGFATSTMTVAKSGAATISGKSSPKVPVGFAVYDKATVKGLVNAFQADVTFRLFPPSDPTCSGSPVFTGVSSANPVGTSFSVVSGIAVPSTPGTYRWTATYEGDQSNAGGVATPCGGIGQTVEILPSSAVDEPPINPVPTAPAKKATGKRAAAMKKCRKAKKKKKKKKCLRRAQKLPV